jgi:hypothetical protein
MAGTEKDTLGYLGKKAEMSGKPEPAWGGDR